MCVRLNRVLVVSLLFSRLISGIADSRGWLNEATGYRKSEEVAYGIGELTAELIVVVRRSKYLVHVWIVR